MPPRPSPLLAAALDYADRGWRIVPVHTAAKGRCSCRKKDTCDRAAKHPRTLHGVKDGTADAAQVRRFWSRWPDANVGVCMGVASGMVALDVDPRHGGDASLVALEAEHGSLPPTIETITGGGGRHLLFLHPGVRVKNSQQELAPGLDIRSDGGLIVAAPSVHANGKRYAWRAGFGPGDVQLADMPQWLLVPEQEQGKRSVQPQTPWTERTEETEDTEETEETDDTEATGVASVSLSSSVSSVLSVQSVDDAIRLTLPSAIGRRNRALFEFARVLRGMPQYAAADLPALRPLVQRWHAAALAIIGTKPFDDTWSDFAYGWPRVRLPAGSGCLRDALTKADAAADPPACASYDCPTTRRLVRLCRQLQRMAGAETDACFFLACRSAADLLGIDHRTAAGRLNMLVGDELLTIVHRGTQSKAARYRCNVP